MHEVKTAFAGVGTVFVDLDNTLWDFAANSRVALAHTHSHYAGGDWMPEFEEFAEVYERRNSELWHDYHHGRVSREHLLGERFRHALEHTGYRGDCRALGRAMNDYYLDDLSHQCATMPGAELLLTVLRRRGYAIYVLSNGFAGVQQRKLASAGLASLVDGVVLSDDCGVTKPQRGIFDFALAQANVTADATVMIGDDPDTDIHGAHDAGWRTIYFSRNGAPPHPGTADAVVQTLEQALDLLPASASRPAR